MKLILIVAAILGLATVSAGQQVYIANEPQMKLMTLDFATGAQTTVYDIGAKPDDLVVNSQGQLIYSVPSLGTVNLFDPTTGSSSVLARGMKYLRDLLIEPSGTTMLISNYARGEIMRLNFATGALTVLAKNLVTVDGLAYDPSGHLFAIADSNTVVQIDPVTGDVLKTLVLEPHSGFNGGDGMTYDAYSGQLWTSHYGTLGNGLIEIATDLSSFTMFQTGHIPFPDGIKSDGKGNLYIGAAWRADMYNIPTDSVVKSYIVKGADGIALVPEGGSSGPPPPPKTPKVYIANEPQMMLMTLDFATGAQGTLYNIGAEPDDLVLNSRGQLIYSVPSLGTVNLFDPATGSNSVMVTGLKYCRDLLIEPGGTTMLISNYARGEIMRFNFTTGTLTVLSKNLGSVDGLAYDPAGHLFAVADSNTVVQIDPATGAVLKTLVLEPHSGPNGGDGMTYDSYTGHLWVSHYGSLGNGLIEIPPDLSGFMLFQTGNIPYPDGIKSDGRGNLFIGAAWRADMYNIPSDTVVKSYIVKGADGIAMVPGTE